MFDALRRGWRGLGQALRVDLRAALGLSRETVLWWSSLGVQAVGSAPQPPMTFESWCSKHPGQSCRLLVAACALHLVDSDASLTLQSAADIHDHVQAQLLHYHGDAALGWPLQVWQDAPHSGASALRGLAVAELRLVARAHRVALVGVHAGWWWAWMQVQARDGATGSRRASAAKAAAVVRGLCVIDEGPAPAGGASAAVLVATGGQLHSACVRRCSEIDSTQLQAWCEQAGLPADAPTRVVAVDSLCAANMTGTVGTAGTAMAATARAGFGPGLLGAAPPSRLSWVAAAAAAMLLATAALDALQAWQLRNSALASLADLETALPPDRPAGTENTELPAWQALLNQPWPQVFAATEAAIVAPVKGLNLTHRGQELRLSAHAPNLQTALAVAATLQRQPGVVTAVLERTVPDDTGVRAELRAQWAPK